MAMWIASAVLHAIALLSMPAALQDDEAYEDPTADEPMRVRVVEAPVDERLAEFEEAPEDAMSRPEPEPEPKPEVKPYLPSTEPVADLQPEDAKFTGRQDTQADRDMVKKGTEGSAVAALRKSDAASSASSPASAAAPKVSDTAEQGKASTPEDPREEPSVTDRDERVEDMPKESDIILPTKQDDTRDGEEKDANVARGALREGKKSLEDAKGLFPSARDAKAVANKLGDGGTFDYLKDVDEGDRTLLNRQQNRYWVFYDRMQRQVERNWKARKEWRKRDPYGNVYGVGSFYTVVAMTLNSDGSIRKMRVSRSSGKEFLDDEATRALSMAGPFPNPPEGMKDEDGLIHINFGFMFEVVSGGGLKLFRARPERPF